MTGRHPTVGLVVVIKEVEEHEAVQRVRHQLSSLIPQSSWSLPESGPPRGRAEMDGARLEVIQWTGTLGAAPAVFIDFDEDEVVQLARRRQRSLLQLLEPYLEAARNIAGAAIVGAGFELSPAADVREESLREAGVALLLTRDSMSDSWTRKELGPFIGHYI